MAVPSSSDVFLSICRRFDSGDGREGIETAFMQVDDDRTGKISFRNLKDIAQQLGEQGLVKGGSGCGSQEADEGACRTNTLQCGVS